MKNNKYVPQNSMPASIVTFLLINFITFNPMGLGCLAYFQEPAYVVLLMFHGTAMHFFLTNYQRSSAISFILSFATDCLAMKSSTTFLYCWASAFVKVVTLPSPSK